MRLALLTGVAMTAFAANSILNRLALADGTIGPGTFALLRVAAGAVVLTALLIARDKSLAVPTRPDVVAVAGLTAYLLGFSYAYVSMDAGLGALVLFGGVQLTMFGGAVAGGDRPPPRRWLGMALAMGGLALLTIPSEAAPASGPAFLLMGIAALGWGMYSLRGRGARDPVRATGWNFLFSLPLVAVCALALPDATGPTRAGVTLALASGGVTSALGYALWYHLLPQLGATRGALAQLSVPAIALGLGAMLLGEAVTGTALLSAALILGGIAVGLLPRSK